MRKVCILLILMLLSVAAVWSRGKEQERPKQCSEVMTEILNVPDGIPQELLDKAECKGYHARGMVKTPPTGEPLAEVLNKKSPKNRSAK